MARRFRLRLSAAAVAVAALWATPLLAHDIPADVAVQAFVRPEGAHLQLLVRVPLVAMRDYVFPTDARGFLDIGRSGPQLREAAQQWIGDALALYEGDARLPKPRLLAVRVSLPSDRSFESWERARAHVTGPPLASGIELVPAQAMLDALFEYPIASAQSRFSIHPALARLGLRVATVLRFLPPGGGVRAFEYLGDPGLVRLDPQWYQAALRFVRLGFDHILGGLDHLLFLCALVIPVRRLRALVPIVTAFTVAHSITLIASAYDLAPDALWFPPLIEALIAASIVYMALENIAGGRLHRRWMIAFGFGLVHGFGFSFALRQTLQFAGSHLLTSLLSFNVGVELGQLLVLALMIPLLALLFRFVVAERMGTIILSAFVAHTGWHWLLDRGAVLGQMEWPAFDLAMAAELTRWAFYAVLMAAVVYVARVVTRSIRGPAPAGDRNPAAS
jgi:hypothetical protein